MDEIFRQAYILAQRKLHIAFRLRISKWFDLSFRIDLTCGERRVDGSPASMEHRMGFVQNWRRKSPWRMCMLPPPICKKPTPRQR